jgi:D-alanyl-D-alanine carboxypeptidase
MAFLESRQRSLSLRSGACHSWYSWVLAGVAILVLTITSSSVMAAGKFASMLVDAETGQVLNEVSADEPRYPASLTKMMTLYMAFEALDNGRWDRQQPLWVSDHAASQPPTKLGLRPGQSIELQDAVLALVTKSANDAAAVIAENLAGTESTFAARMTAKARALGMSRTTFRNASGLPDPDQITTARDMTTLAMALLYHFPHHYHYFGTQSFYWRGRAFANHNHMLHTYYGVDGIKTGYTRASGFNLVASAQRDGRRLLGVVLGAPSPATRSAIMGDLFDQAFLGSTSVEVANLSRYANTAAGGADEADSGPSAAYSSLAPARAAYTAPARSARAAAPARRATVARAAPRASTKTVAAASRRAPVTQSAQRGRSTAKAVAAKPAPARVAAARAVPARTASKPAVATVTKVVAKPAQAARTTKAVKTVQKAPPPAPRRGKVTAGRSARPS